MQVILWENINRRFWDNEEHYFQQTVEWLSKKICTAPALIQQSRTDFVINPFTRTVADKTGNVIQLTAKEFDLLYFLISHRGQVFTKEQIYENVWGYDYPADPNNLTSFIRKLRKKIEPEPERPRYILLSEVLDISTRKMRKEQENQRYRRSDPDVVAVVRHQAMPTLLANGWFTLTVGRACEPH